MKNRIRTIAAVVILATAGTAAAVFATSSAFADTRICDQYGSMTVGNYKVQNNRWGTSATQCINVTSTGFSIVQQDGTGNLSGAPVSYPSIFLGCHYNLCSPGFTPRRINEIGSSNSSISLSYPSGGTWDAAYDIWLNADSNTSGVQDTEIMIWLNHQGSIQPIGSQTGSVNIAGRNWAVWTGSNGANNVVSYVSSGISSISFSVLDFVRDTFTRGSHYGNNNWYLTSIQAGFEPWIGGVGLSVNSFSASVNAGTPPTSAAQTTRAPVTTRGPVTSAPVTTGGGQPGTCSATYKTVGSWSGGFQAEVTVRNNGSSTLNGWTVNLGLQSGQTINSLWSGVNSGTSGNVSVRNAPYNGSLAGGASTTFGFVANGNGASTPSVSCTSP
ncbi:cellulose binding domain-containing protein [Luedemannella flava]|uniref:Cellulose binding domain-containing protein n=1 Tax=Luedemannella flava TaxID=349316 RepID=A0ABN2LRK2_9ACTN